MPETFGHYTVLDRLGAGGLGDLYKARDTRSGRTVALRVLSEALTADAEASARLAAGLEAAVKLSHPNIASLYEIGDQDGRRFMALEFVPGESLERLTGGQALHPLRAIDLAIQIADGLAEAHSYEIEHHHLSMANVLVTSKGRVKILDFGSAQWTKAGATHGRRADLAALGLLLAELLHGRAIAATMPSARSGPPGSPVADAAAVAEALASGTEAFTSAATAAATLRSIAERLTTDAPSPVSAHPAREARRSLRTPVTWAVVLVLLIGVAWLVWLAMR
jgi:serine/threonine protein kinase